MLSRLQRKVRKQVAGRRFVAARGHTKPRPWWAAGAWWELVEVKARAEVKAPEALIQMETQRKKISTAYLQVWIVRVKMGIPSFSDEATNWG